VFPGFQTERGIREIERGIEKEIEIQTLMILLGRLLLAIRGRLQSTQNAKGFRERERGRERERITSTEQKGWI
jgi:hypothetical protein